MREHEIVTQQNTSDKMDFNLQSGSQYQNRLRSDTTVVLNNQKARFLLSSLFGVERDNVQKYRLCEEFSELVENNLDFQWRNVEMEFVGQSVLRELNNYKEPGQ